MAASGKLAVIKKRKSDDVSAVQNPHKSPKIGAGSWKDGAQSTGEAPAEANDYGKNHVADKAGGAELLDRKARKELSEARKKERRPNYDLEKDVTALWEKMRQRNVDPAEQKRLASSILSKTKGKLRELSLSHTSSRIVQACVKHCSKAERAEVFAELRPHCLDLAKNTYAHHLVNKMLDHANKQQRTQMLTSFHGKVVSLLRHPSASHVVERAFQTATGAQKQALVSEFYAPEYRLFKGIETAGQGRLADIMAAAAPSKRRLILEHMSAALQPILEKGIVDHSIAHRAIADFLSVATKSLVSDVVEHLAGPLLVRMLHTRDGARVASLCVAAGSAKERKKAVKGLKDHCVKAAMDDHGNRVIVQILDSVDDTMLVRKVVVAELQKELLPLSLHKYGSRVLLHLLAPRTPRYFPADVIQDLQPLVVKAADVAADVAEKPVGGSVDEAEEGLPQKKKKKGKGKGKEEEKVDGEGEEEGKGEEGGEGEEGSLGGSKKDPALRRWELLQGSGLAKELASVCVEHAGELLRSQHGADIIFEVASGAAEGMMWRAAPAEVAQVHAAIAELAALDRPETGAEPSEHINKGRGKQKNKKQKSAEGEEIKGGSELGGEGDGGRDRGGGDGVGVVEQHVLDDFFASRTIRRLVQDSAAPPVESGALPFATVLWERALKGRCHLWAETHSSKVLAALASCQHDDTRAQAQAELRPLLVQGKLKCVDQWLPEELKGASSGVVVGMGKVRKEEKKNGKGEVAEVLVGEKGGAKKGKGKKGWDGLEKGLGEVGGKEGEGKKRKVVNGKR